MWKTLTSRGSSEEDNSTSLLLLLQLLFQNGFLVLCLSINFFFLVNVYVYTCVFAYVCIHISRSSAPSLDWLNLNLGIGAPTMWIKEKTKTPQVIAVCSQIWEPMLFVITGAACWKQFRDRLPETDTGFAVSLPGDGHRWSGPRPGSSAHLVRPQVPPWKARAAGRPRATPWTLRPASWAPRRPRCWRTCCGSSSGRCPSWPPSAGSRGCPRVVIRPPRTSSWSWSAGAWPTPRSASGWAPCPARVPKATWARQPYDPAPYTHPLHMLATVSDYYLCFWPIS